MALHFNAEDVEFVVAGQFFLLGNKAAIQRGGEANVERVFRVPVLAIIMRLFAPRIHPVPYGDHSVPNMATFINTILSSWQKSGLPLEANILTLEREDGGPRGH